MVSIFLRFPQDTAEADICVNIYVSYAKWLIIMSVFQVHWHNAVPSSWFTLLLSL